jgi:Arc/MetJ-type ribon-helix-helix transcriptional regulator
MVMTTLTVELPDQLRQQLRAFVAQGWFSSENELVQEAVRRFLEARAPELAARFVKEDVEWGLKGND